MFQQVNLYQPIFREERKLFSATAICTGLGIVAAGLVAITCVSWWQVSSLSRQLDGVAAQERARAGLSAASQHLFERGETEQSLTAHVQTLALALDRRQRVLRYLASGKAGSNQGFATRLEALAREQIDGLWLKGATFTAEPGRFALAGSAINAELVPRYLARLANEPALSGAKVESLEIREPKATDPRSGDDKSPAAGRIDFIVSSAPQTAGKDTRLALSIDAPGSP
jgi:hypothetical protein